MRVEELTKIHKVLGAGLMAKDGSIIESRIGFDYDVEKLGMMASRVVQGIKKSLSVEKPSVILYTRENVFFTREIERGIVFVICQNDANIGLVKIKIDKII